MPAETKPADARAGRASPGKLAILYDGNCELCRASITAIRSFDASGQIEALDLHGYENRARFEQVRLKDLLEEVHAVDDQGRVWRGARAINEILRRQPGLRGWLAYAWYLPGYAWLARWQYRRIATSRYEHDTHGKPKEHDLPQS